MTRQDYIRIADSIASAHLSIEADYVGRVEERIAMARLLFQIINSLSSSLKEDNDRFDSARFEARILDTLQMSFLSEGSK